MNEGHARIWISVKLSWTLQHKQEQKEAAMQFVKLQLTSVAERRGFVQWERRRWVQLFQIFPQRRLHSNHWPPHWLTAAMISFCVYFTLIAEQGWRKWANKWVPIMTSSFLFCCSMQVKQDANQTRRQRHWQACVWLYEKQLKERTEGTRRIAWGGGLVVIGAVWEEFAI